MSMIRPSQQMPDPDSKLVGHGEFVAKCTRVQQGLPNRRYPDGKPLMAIEFTVHSPDDTRVHGKTASILCGESVYVDPDSGRESHLVTHARSMGVLNPEFGFDPQRFVGRWYLIDVRMIQGRPVVQTAVLTETPTICGDTQSGQTATTKFNPAANGKPPF